MMIRLTYIRQSLLFLFCVLGVIPVQAQREMDNWLFSQFVNINFGSGNPVQGTNSPLNAAEGSATISDASGNLLFYTDGSTIWTATHAVMQNGSGLMGHFSSSQAALIIPVPGSTTQYYVFTNGHHNDNNGLRYSIVDMSLNSGAGAVTSTKNVLLVAGPNTEKLTAVKHCNRTDFWVLTRGWQNTQFMAFLVTSAGINTTPVISNSTFNTNTLSSTPGIGTVGRIGYMKAAPTGTRIATFHAWSNVVELAEFNPWNGQFTNILVLNALPASFPKQPPPQGYIMPYTGEFSPNGRYLYTLVNYWVTGMGANPKSILYQFDVSTMNINDIEASRFKIDSLQSLELNYNGAGAIQIANNGKLYVGYSWHQALSVINNPNDGGAACNYQYDPFPLANGATFRAGFPNFFPFFAAAYAPSDFTFTGNCEGPDVKFAFNNPHEADSVIWNFDDPASGADNESRQDSPMHRFSSTGLHKVRLIIHKTAATICHDPIDTITKEVFIPYLNLGNDTTLCADSLLLPRNGITHPGGKYLWNTGDTTASIYAKASGMYWLEQTQYGCTIRDSIELDLNGDPLVYLGSDTGICNTDLPYILSVAQPPGTAYAWSDGTTGTQMTVTQAGTYWLSVSLNACKGSDTINISVIETPVFDIGNDTIICKDWPVRIGANVADALYDWNTGEVTSHIDVNVTGAYILAANRGRCIGRDTVNIVAMPAPEINLGDDRDICDEQTITLDATYQTNSSYLWNTGDTTAVYVAIREGVYAVRVTSEHGCIGYDTIIFKHSPSPEVILGNDTTVCEDVPLTIMPVYYNHEESMVWSTGSTERQIDITEGGVFIVNVANKCGTDADTIVVNQVFCDIRLPNVFTPNGDGINDILKILGNVGRMQSVIFSIYNRWGELLFTTHDQYKGWDGKQKGGDVMEGTYVYVLQYNLDGRPYMQKGNFHLIR